MKQKSNSHITIIWTDKTALGDVYIYILDQLFLKTSDENENSWSTHLRMDLIRCLLSFLAVVKEDMKMTGITQEAAEARVRWKWFAMANPEGNSWKEKDWLLWCI